MSIHPRHGIRSGATASRPRPDSRARACWRLSGSSQLRASANSPLAPATGVRDRPPRDDLVIPSARSEAGERKRDELVGTRSSRHGWPKHRRLAVKWRGSTGSSRRCAQPVNGESTIASDRSSGHARAIGRQLPAGKAGHSAFRDRGFREAAEVPALRLKASRSPTGR
jgi:hypothetical protein